MAWDERGLYIDLTISPKTGGDKVIDLTKGWGPRYPHPLNVDKLPDEELQNIAFLFGGVGDGMLR